MQLRADLRNRVCSFGGTSAVEQTSDPALWNPAYADDTHKLGAEGACAFLRGRHSYPLSSRTKAVQSIAIFRNPHKQTPPTLNNKPTSTRHNRPQPL